MDEKADIYTYTRHTNQPEVITRKSRHVCVHPSTNHPRSSQSRKGREKSTKGPHKEGFFLPSVLSLLFSSLSIYLSCLLGSLYVSISTLTPASRPPPSRALFLSSDDNPSSFQFFLLGRPGGDVVLPPAVPGLEEARVRLAHEVDEASRGHHHALVGVLAVRGQVLRSVGAWVLQGAGPWMGEGMCG